jgi:putative transposase
LLQQAGMRTSMDGRGRWMDNVFIERLWRSLKYECVYLHAFETGTELRTGLSKWIGYYNAGRPHSALAEQTPNEACGAGEMTRLAARRNQDRAHPGRQTVRCMGATSNTPAANQRCAC